MIQYTEEIKAILIKINEGTASLEEKERFQEWYNSFDDSSTVIEANSSPEMLKEEIWISLQKRKPIQKIAWMRYTAAAAVILLCGAAVMLFSKKSDPATSELALLRSGLQVVDANAQVHAFDAEVSNFLDTTYYVDLLALSGAQEINAVFTEKGQFSKLILPDGTKVSMNADTKLKLSPDFAKATQRTVDLVGEAYFEVSSLPNQSFVVRSGTQEVKVLGTKFNVKAYPNQDIIKTNLIEGKIELIDGTAKTLLLPQQEALNKKGVIAVEAKALESNSGWRALSFDFDKEGIEDVLLQLARWYKLELVFESQIPSQKISGKISRGTSLKDLQAILTNLTQGTYRLKEDTLFVKFKNN